MAKSRSKNTGWPGRGDRAFVDSDDPHLDIQFMQATSFDRHYISGFQKAADTVIDAMATRLGMDRSPEMFIAAAFLYRQALELHMKYIMGMSNHVGETSFTRKELHGHKLGELWRHTRKALTKTWPDGSKHPLNMTARIVKEFEAVDESGQEFRYSRRTDERESLKNLPSNPDAQKLKRTMGKVYTFFECCSSGLDAYWDSLNSNADY
jgi:hypothetical protein